MNGSLIKSVILKNAPVVESVDAPDSKSGSFGSASSSLAGGTITSQVNSKHKKSRMIRLFVYFN